MMATRIIGPLLALGLASACGGAGALAADETIDTYAVLARELVEGLQAGDDEWRKLHGRPRRIAVAPFARNEAPLPAATTATVHDSFLNALVRAAANRFAVVAREDLTDVFRDLQEVGAGGQNPLPSLIESAKADVLVKGTLQRAGEKVAARYRAISVADGQIVAGTKLYQLPLGPDDLYEATRLTLNAAVDEAAKRLIEGAADLRELRLGTIHFQDSGTQPTFGRYLRDRLAAALAQAASGRVSGRYLMVRPAEGDLTRLMDRGLTAEGRLPKPELESARPGTYLLTGSYWVFDNLVEIRPALEGEDGRWATWSGQVRLDSIPGGLALKPPADFAELRENDGIGPFRFELTSERGPDPAYRVGETLQLAIGLGRDAWVHCYYKQADGKVFRFFPNAHHRDARLAGGIVHTVPGRIMPFDLRFTEPAGVELLKCFALAEDPSEWLPRELRDLGGAPLAPETELRLPQIYRRLGRSGLSEASLVLTVEK